MSKSIWTAGGEFWGNIGDGPEFPFGIPGCGFIVFCFVGGVFLAICFGIGGALGVEIPGVLKFLTISATTGYLAIMLIPGKYVSTITYKSYLIAGVIYLVLTIVLYQILP